MGVHKNKLFHHSILYFINKFTNPLKEPWPNIFYNKVKINNTFPLLEYLLQNNFDSKQWINKLKTYKSENMNDIPIGI